MGVDTGRRPELDLAELAVRLQPLASQSEVADAAVVAVPWILGRGAAALHLSRRRRLVPCAAGDRSLRAAADLQLSLGEGPTLDVREGSASVCCPDLAATDRWRWWAPIANALGWRSWLCLRLTSRQRHTLGVLTVADPAPHAIDEVLDRASVLAAHLAVALDLARIRDNLTIALDARERIGRAIGVLMERHRMDADEAFEYLRWYSQDHNVKLCDLAAGLLDDGELPLRENR